MNTTPKCVIFAGPNGSGKSTLIRKLFADPFYDVPERYINADDIARDMTEGSQLEKEKSAFRQARRLREEYRLAGLSYSFETVFSHPSTLLDLIKLREMGYETTFVFVATVSAEINVTRVSKRFKTGGHDVPKDKIRSRYERAFQFLPLAAEIAGQTSLYDNTNELELVCNVEDGVAIPTVYCNPYYETRFVFPFDARRRERDALYQSFINLQPAEIKSGVYNGPVSVDVNYYCVQNVNGKQILHDRTLLTSEPDQNQFVQISYRDGYGTIHGLNRL